MVTMTLAEGMSNQEFPTAKMRNVYRVDTSPALHESGYSAPSSDRINECWLFVQLSSLNTALRTLAVAASMQEEDNW